MVSVIIPAFNSQNFIAHSVESVLMQAYHNFELLIIDDYSTDDTSNIVMKFAEENEKIRKFVNRRKKGPSGARNTGLENAKGDYIAFLDADDIWLPHHLDQGVQFLDRNRGINAVFFNFNIIEMTTQSVIGDWFSERKFSKHVRKKCVDDNFYLICENMFNLLLDESFIQLQSLMLRKEAYDNIFFNEEIMRGEDLDFIIKISKNTNTRFAFSDRITSNYYRHDNSLTTHRLDKIIPTLKDHITLFRNYYNECLEDEKTKGKLKEILYNRHVSLSYCYRNQNNINHALVYLMKSLRYGMKTEQIVELIKIFVAYCKSIKGKSV